MAFRYDLQRDKHSWALNRKQLSRQRQERLLLQRSGAVGAQLPSADRTCRKPVTTFNRVAKPLFLILARVPPTFASS
jgi:hypothetical protein